MNHDEQIDKIITAWQNALGDSHPFGLSNGALVALAETAARDLSGQPQQWGEGNQIPPTVTTVWDSRGVQWTREYSNFHQCTMFTARVEDCDLIYSVGTVYASRPDPETLEDHENDGACTECGAHPGAVHRWACPHRETGGSGQCGETGLKGGVCHRPAGHVVDPEDRDTWHCTATGNLKWCISTGPAPAEDPYTPVFRSTAALLEAAGAKLHKLSATYKGSATRGVERLAVGCDESAAALRSLITNKEHTQ